MAYAMSFSYPIIFAKTSSQYFLLTIDDCDLSGDEPPTISQLYAHAREKVPSLLGGIGIDLTAMDLIISVFRV